MIATIVGVDIAFFRGEFWERLMANAGIAVVFVALYLLLGGAVTGRRGADGIVIGAGRL